MFKPELWQSHDYREYNMKRIKKITACFLIVALTLCSFSLNIQAKGYKPADNSVTITADMDEPYTIKSNPDNIYGDILSVYVQNSFHIVLPIISMRNLFHFLINSYNSLSTMYPS